MSLVDFVFTSVGARALSSLLKLVTATDILRHLFLRFQHNHLQIFFPTATSVKISQNSEIQNSVKKSQKFGYICISSLPITDNFQVLLTFKFSISCFLCIMILNYRLYQET